MANLETLFIEIDGNASKASNGINQLMISLSALGSVVSSNIGGLREMSSLMKEMASSSNVAGSNLMRSIAPISAASTTAGIKKTTKAISDLGKVQKTFPTTDAFGNQLNTNLPLITSDGRVLKFATEQDLLAKSAKKAVPSISEYKDEIEQSAKVTEQAAESTTQLAVATREVSRTRASIQATSKATRGLMSTIGRIAKTMLIRSAIRSVMKLAKQGVQNFYQYSKAINSSYATALDKLAISGGKAGNQLGAAIGSLLAAVAPVLNTIIALATAAASALSALFSLFGGGTTFSKATDGMNSFAKATGGGGSAMKELLADFDEFNIIASEGGGGGGGGGNFSAMFEESPIPQWMIEWKPLLEAIILGIGSALIFPKIFDWIKKILDLFTGGGASDFFRFMKYFKKEPGDDGDLFNFPSQPDYKQFPQQPDYKPFPVMPTYQEFPAAPDYGKFATDCGIIAGALTVAAPMAETLVSAFSKLKGIFDAGSLLKDLLTALFGKLVGGTTSIKIDRKEFDDFKKDWEEFKKSNSKIEIQAVFNEHSLDYAKSLVHEWTDKIESKYVTVHINIPETAYNDMNSIDSWAHKLSEKTVQINVKETEDALKNKNSIDAWAHKLLEKFVYVSIKKENAYKDMNSIDAWSHKADTKSVTVNILHGAADEAIEIIDEWANALNTKKILVWIDAAAANVAAEILDYWASLEPTKTIHVELSGLKVINDAAELLTEWVELKQTKTIKVTFSGLKTVNEAVGILNEWIGLKQTKTINVTFSGLKTVNTAVEFLNEWINLKQKKTISVTFSGLKAVNEAVDILNEWIDLKQTKTIKVTLSGLKTVNEAVGILNEWVDASATKTINVEVAYTFAAIIMQGLIELWAAESLTKTIDVDVKYTDMGAIVVKTANAWVAESAKKTITVDVSYAFGAKVLIKSIDDWCAATTKKITVDVSISKTALDNMDIVDKFIKDNKKKTIKVDFPSVFETIINTIVGWGTQKVIEIALKYADDYGDIVQKVTAWVTGIKGKIITVAIDTASYKAFNKTKTEIDNWVKQSVTKTITISMKYTTTGVPTSGTSGSSGSSGSGSSNGSKGSLLDQLGQGIVNLVNDPIGQITGAFNQLWKDLGFASGGFPPQGDLFIANEAGAELVGSFGNRTAVANNDMIVEGIREGVADANSEQNALLRQQNELLRGILEKDTTFRLGASSALGRVAKQSLDMYNTMVGG